MNEYKVWFVTDILKSSFFLHNKNYGRIEIVGIFFTIARLKYLSGSEMSTCQLSGCYNKEIFKNHNLCLKLFLSF